VRIAALFCGLIAGLFALVAPAGLGVDLLTPFLGLWGPTPGQQLLGTMAWYAPVGAALLGGLLAFVAPGPGAMLLAAAGAGWLGVGAFDFQFFRMELLVPGIVSLTGALLAFLAGELELRSRRAARRQRREMLRQRERAGFDDRDEPDEPPLRADRHEREDLHERSGRRGRRGRDDSEARAREEAYSLDPLTVSREEAPPRPSREIPLTLEDVAPVDPPEPPRRRTDTIWPDAPTGRRSLFDRDPAPDLQPRRSLFERPATRVDREDRGARRGRDRDDPREYRARDYHDDEPAPRRNMLVWILAGNAVVLVVLGLVIAYILAGRSPGDQVAPVVAATETPAAPAAETPVPAVPAVADADDRLTPNMLPSLALPGAELPMGPDGAPMVATVGPAAVAVAESAPAPAGGFTDPFAYCSAVRTIDYVDARYAGPRFTAAIADALRVPMGSAPDRVSWRCVDGVVYACASFDWPVCAMTPTAQEMLEYCQRNPGVTRLLAPNGTWSCEGNRPRIPEGASWPVDARGFFPPAWIPVLPPQAPTG